MVTLLPLPLPPSAPGASQHGFRSVFFVVCFEKRSHFHFQGAPNVFSCSGPSRLLHQARDPAGPLPPSPGNPSPPRAGRVDQGRAGLSAARSAAGARRGFRSRAGARKGAESQTAQCPAARAQRRDHTAPLVQGGRAMDEAGLSPRALSSGFCRDRHGASGGSRGAAGTPGALPPPAAQAERSAALTLNSPCALWLHGVRAEPLEV